MAAAWATFKETLTVDMRPIEDDDAGWQARFGTSGYMPPKAWVATRACLFVFWFGVTLWSFIDWAVEEDGEGRPGYITYWFTKLTHWGLVLECVYLGLATFTSYKAVFSDANDARSIRPAYVIVTLVLQNIMLPVSFMIFLMYWTLVFSGTLYVLSTFTHGVNFVVMVVDALLNRQPVRAAQVVFPVAFALLYLAFTLIYWAAGGTFEDGSSPYIYAALNWQNPRATSIMAFIIVLVITPVLYLCVIVGCYRVEIMFCDPRQQELEAKTRSEL